MAKITSNTKNALTNKAVKEYFNSDQSYREEAAKMTKEFLAKFGVFVGFYNKVNNSSLSVEDALWNDEVLALFQTSVSLAKANNQNQQTTAPSVAKATKTTKRPRTTKSISYEQFKAENGTGVAYKIYKYLKNQPEPLSRIEIARGVGIRLSTVCGQIPLLAEAGLVSVAGRKIDLDSNREVETIVAF